MDELLDYLAGCRDAFAAVDVDMRHVLQWYDADSWIAPAERWRYADPGRDFSTWGMPPGHIWRKTPDDFRARPVIVQIPEYGHPYHWRHTFHGEAAMEALELLSYRVVRELAEQDAAVYQGWPRPVPIEVDPPSNARDTAHLWWMRVVHGFATFKPRRSDLRSTVGVPQRCEGMAPNPWNSEVVRRIGRPPSGPTFSVLWGNVFEASAWALDFWIELARSATGNRGTTISLPGPVESSGNPLEPPESVVDALGTAEEARTIKVKIFRHVADTPRATVDEIRSIARDHHRSKDRPDEEIKPLSPDAIDRHLRTINNDLRADRWICRVKRNGTAIRLIGERRRTTSHDIVHDVGQSP